MLVVMGPAPIIGSDPVSQFRTAMIEAGIDSPDEIEADRQPHPFPTNGKLGGSAGWYVFHEDNLSAGTFNYLRAGVNETGDTEPEISKTIVAGLP